MFEDQTYEELVKRALARIPASLDKREGSVVFNGVAPSMAEVAQLYTGLDFILQATYLSTAPREYLIKRAAERNLVPYPASAAVFRAECDREIPAGTRFSCEAFNFAVVNRLPEFDAETMRSYRVVCETAGSAANSCAGTLVPVEYIPGLTRAELADLLIPGDDEEETETFRQRVLGSFQDRAFGGNQADYREKVLSLPGVRAVKVHPAWNGEVNPASLIPDAETAAWYASVMDTLPASPAAWLRAVYTAAEQKQLTVGGCVELVILASNHAAPPDALIEEVQAAVDPVQNAGEGRGLAPIGHVVHVKGVTAEPVDVTLHVTYAAGWSWDAAQSYIKAVLDAYFAELAESWAASDFLTVRISQIESRILSCCAAMVADIGGTQINGAESNLALHPDSIPVRGTVYG